MITCPPRDEDLDVESDRHVLLAAATSPINRALAALEFGLTNGLTWAVRDC